MTAPVDLTRQPDGVARITLRRPDQLNALSSHVVVALHAAVDEVAADDDVRAIVVAGEGKAFCAGADIRELDRLDGPHGFSRFVHGLTDAFDALEACPKPSVAAIHGVAFGGGLELALACDLRVAEAGARLGVPEIRLGLLPGAGGTARLPRLLPKAVAKQLLLTGEPLSADDAFRLGLVNEIVPAGGAVEAACALAARLAGLAPLALAAAKRLVDVGATLSLGAAIDLERDTVSVLFGTDDRIEGVAAFLEKRTATFGGR